MYLLLQLNLLILWLRPVQCSKYFPQSLLHYQYTFSTFVRNPLTRPHKQSLLKLRNSVPARRRPQNGAFGVHPLAGLKNGGPRVLN